MLQSRIVSMLLLCLLALSVVAQNIKPIENQDVIKLTRAGLSEDVIIAKIKSSSTRFDTSTDAILQLKQAGVKDRVLEAMLSEGKPTTQPAQSPTSKPNVAASKHYPAEIGLYINQEGKWHELPAEKADWKTGGILKGFGRASIIGGGGADVDIYVNGPTSALTAPRKAEFLLHVAEGDAPASYQLVKLTQKKDRREFKNGRSGFIGMKNGPGKAAVTFEANKVAAGIYLIKLDLEPGEYCFFKAAAGLNSDTGLVYSFKIV